MENIVKRNCLQQAISPFLTMFSTLEGTYFSFQMYFKISSAMFQFGPDQSKILLSGSRLKGLNVITIKHETEAQRKKLENGSRIWGSTTLREVFSSYEEHRIFSSDLLESQDPPLTFKNIRNRTNLVLALYFFKVLNKSTKIIPFPPRAPGKEELDVIFCTFWCFCPWISRSE